MDKKEIYEIIAKLNDYKDRYETGKFCKKQFLLLCDDITAVMHEWCGNTWVGNKKDKDEKRIYQDFFGSLSCLIKKMVSSPKKQKRIEKDFLEYIIYQGFIYRYLGYSFPSDVSKKNRIEIEYNDIYVSWSKNKTVSYIESKLYGNITWMCAEITDENFGIDIENFGVFMTKYRPRTFQISKGEEREVVFPTLEKAIREIRYIDYDEEENE